METLENKALMRFYRKDLTMPKKPVLDPKGEELGRVKDLVVVKGEPLPKISSLIIEKKRKFFNLPWTDLNIFNKRIISANIYSEGLKTYEFSEEDLLLVRDIFDKQIVDANGAKVVRVNDVKLEGFNTEAVLIAVDVGDNVEITINGKGGIIFIFKGSDKIRVIEK